MYERRADLARTDEKGCRRRRDRLLYIPFHRISNYAYVRVARRENFTMEFFPDGLLPSSKRENRLLARSFAFSNQVFPKLVCFQDHSDSFGRVFDAFCHKGHTVRRDGRYYIHHRIRPPPLSALLPSHSIHN